LYNPFKRVEGSDKGICEQNIIMDKLTIGTTGAVRDTPAEGFGGTREDFGTAGSVLKADKVRGGNRTRRKRIMKRTIIFPLNRNITEATGINDGEEFPAKLGFHQPVELDRDDPTRKRFVQHCPQALTHAGGIHDDILGTPTFGKSLQLTKEGEMVETNPLQTVKDAVGGGLECGEGSQVDGDNGKGGGIAGRIFEGDVVGGKVHAGFVLTGEIEEESNGRPSFGVNSPTPSPTPTLPICTYCKWRGSRCGSFGAVHRRLISSMWRRGG
jgi:hypothetical protein